MRWFLLALMVSAYLCHEPLWGFTEWPSLAFHKQNKTHQMTKTPNEQLKNLKHDQEGQAPPSIETLPALKPQLQEKRWAIGLGVSIPDFLPVEGYFFALPWLGFRFFGVFSIPFKVRVEYERSVLASQGGLSLENPDLNIDFDGIYGPQYGLESLIHPFSSSFYFGLGMSYRKLELKGGLLSNVILTSSAGSVDTNSLISLRADAETAQFVYRLSTGWLWTFWEEKAFVNFTMIGLTIPNQAKSRVFVKADIINPIATVDVKNETIEQAEQRFADDLARQAKRSLKPVETLSLPIIGLSGGYRF